MVAEDHRWTELRNSGKNLALVPMDSGTILDSVAEAHLLARVAKKDADAFSEFYDRTSAVLFSVATSILRDETLAEDVLQDVYLQIWDKAEVFDPDLGKPISWAIALTRNKALDRLRSSKRRESAMQEFADASEVQASESAPANVELKETADVVKRAMSRLSDKQRDAIELALLRGMAHSEVAEAMQQPLGTVKAWIRRGIIEIREQLKNHV
jgi:RNA polymerase sigma-70 factor (ECF subfamily)